MCGRVYTDVLFARSSTPNACSQMACFCDCVGSDDVRTTVHDSRSTPAVPTRSLSPPTNGASIDDSSACLLLPLIRFERLPGLISFFQDYRDDLVVIFAGYKKEMQVLMQSNSGLASRFPTWLDFKDYTAMELHFISQSMLKEGHMKLTPGANELLLEAFEMMVPSPLTRPSFAHHQPFKSFTTPTPTLTPTLFTPD